MKTNKISFNRIIIILITLAPCLYSIITTNILNDWYWHIRIGEYIVNEKIPKIGIFSWYAESNQLPWIAHEWLSEVILWFITKDSQTIALIFGKICSILLVLILAILSTRDCEKHMIQSSILSILSSLCACSYAYARPHVFSYFLLFITIYISDRAIKKNDKSCLLLIPLSILWSNMHGGSSNLVYIIPIILSICSLFNFDLFKISFGNNENKKGAKNTIICSIISIFCIAINPYGYEMIIYPYSNMQDEIMLSYITEWVIPSINDFYGFLMFFCLVIAIFVFCNTKKEKIQAKDVILIAFGTFLFLKAARFFPYFAIILCYILPNYMPIEREEKMKLPYKFKVGIITFVSVVSICLPTMGVLDIIGKNLEEEDVLITIEMVEKVKEYNPSRLYNHFNYGGYLIYNEIPCFIDGRADMYTKNDDVFKEFIDISHNAYVYNPTTTIEEYIEKYQFDAFLCQKNDITNYYLKNNDNYFVYYEDEYSVFWVEKESGK